jgi:hypothetical protein
MAHERAGVDTAVDGVLGQAHGVQADPGAAAFVAGGETPPAHAEARAVAVQHFTHAAGASGHDGAWLAPVGTQQHRVGVGLDDQLAVPRVSGHEGIAPGVVADTGERGSQGTLVQRRHGPATGGKRGAHGAAHLHPGGRNALPQRRRACMASSDGRAITQGNHRPRAGSSAIHPDQELDHHSPSRSSASRDVRPRWNE